MSCNYEDCKQEIKALCDSCPTAIYLCMNHSWCHNSETGHKFKFIKLEDSKSAELKSVRNKLKFLISQISKDTAEIISELKKASNHAIKNLKIMNKTLKNISEFKEVSFERKRVLYIINEIKILSEEMKNLPQERVLKNSPELPEDKSQDISKELLESKKIIIQQEERIKELTNESSENRKQLYDSRQIIVRLQEENMLKDKSLQDMLYYKNSGYATHNPIPYFHPQQYQYIRAPQYNPIIQNPTFQNQEIEKKGQFYLEFNEMTLQDKKLYVQSTWTYIKCNRYTDKEFLLSSDKKFLFICNHNVGIVKKTVFFIKGVISIEPVTVFNKKLVFAN